MKKLYNYICEMAKLNKSDWNKLKYIEPVINALCNNDYILVGTNGETSVTITSDMKKYFNKEFAKYGTNITKEEFDKVTGRYGLYWNNIFKGVFSGHLTNTKGQRVEALVCYMFNDSKADPELFKQEMMPDLTDYWIESSRRTVTFINKQTGISNIPWTSDNYVACRVDGNDFKLDNKYEFAKQITSIFTGKKTMNKIFKQYNKAFNCDDLYTGNKDIWNKADIVLVHKELAKNLINDIGSQRLINGIQLNNILIQYTKQGVIIPISLKMLTNDNAQLSSINIINSDSDNIINHVKYIKIGKYSEDTTVGSFTISCNTTDNKNLDLVFRRTTDPGNNLNIEPQISGDKSRLAKAVAVIKGMLGLKRGNSYYVYTETIDEAINKLKLYYGFDINIDKKSNYNTVNIGDKKYALQNRACCAGLLGILQAYEKLVPIDKDFQKNFANFCVLSAMGLNSKGAFYKISN